jgi:hypothetical protein
LLGGLPACWMTRWILYVLGPAAQLAQDGDAQHKTV